MWVFLPCSNTFSPNPYALEAEHLQFESNIFQQDKYFAVKDKYKG